MTESAQPLDARVVELVAFIQDLAKGIQPQFMEPAQDELDPLRQALNFWAQGGGSIGFDPLTGLNNHRTFMDALEREAQNSIVTGQTFAIVFFDLDHFSAFNQGYGRRLADEALRTAGRCFASLASQGHIVARFGGEEFAVLYVGHDLDQSEILADSVRAQIKAQFEINGWHDLTLSAGCAEYGASSSQIHGLVLAAELALSRAKNLGRNCTCRFDNLVGADAKADPSLLHAFMENGSFAIMEALAAAVDAKDPHTQGHSMRVSRYAADLARFMGLGEAEIDLVYRAGTLHDVGKIGIPDAILCKPSLLTREEVRIMETHPAMGEEIVRKVPQLEDCRGAVLHHHEHYDGKGYPDGIAGEDIPWCARYVSVADTFDAMTSCRPYREGLSVEAALREIEARAGTQFDPKLALAFISMIRINRPEYLREVA